MFMTCFSYRGRTKEARWGGCLRVRIQILVIVFQALVSHHTALANRKIDWSTCDWKIGNSIRSTDEIFVGVVNRPNDCIIKCTTLHNAKGESASQATVDTRSGRYCYCHFNSTSTNDRFNWKTCNLNIGMTRIQQTSKAITTTQSTTPSTTPTTPPPPPLSTTRMATMTMSISTTKIIHDWNSCNWKIGDGTGDNKKMLGRVLDPKECISKCRMLRSEQGDAANQAIVDSRSGHYCYCRFNSTGINTHLTDWKTCQINVETRTTPQTPTKTRTTTTTTTTASIKTTPSKSAAKSTSVSTTKYVPDWSTCNWKIGDGIGDKLTIGKVSGPKECINRCIQKGQTENQATVDTRSGRYCFCRFNSTAINNRVQWKTCNLHIDATIITTTGSTPRALTDRTGVTSPAVIAPESSRTENVNSKNTTIIISALTATGFGAVLIILFLLIVHRRRKMRSRHIVDDVRLTSLTEIPEHMHQNTCNPYYNKTLGPGNNNIGFMPPEEAASDRIYITEFARDRLTYIAKLGEGAFGKVVKCKLAGNETNEDILCAVKYLKQGASEYTQSTFMREAETLASFDHPNIIRLLGACLDDDGPPCIVLEFIKFGDLAEYIRDRSGSYHASFSRNGELPADIEYEPPLLSHQKLIYIADQIASGMAYLSERKFVHRDIATRNCLVGNQLLIKIADFGLGHDISTTDSDYYRIDGQKLLPVRWLPPEALTMGKFTIASDIWSYGVLLWELFSYGMAPYCGDSNEVVIKKIKCYEILEYPHDCPQRVYELMQDCWRYDPTKRIPFKNINQILTDWINNNEYDTLCTVQETIH